MSGLKRQEPSAVKPKTFFLFRLFMLEMRRERCPSAIKPKTQGPLTLDIIACHQINFLDFEMSKQSKLFLVVLLCFAR